MLKASQTGWHSLDSNPSLADSKVGALPNVLCCSLASGACTLSPSSPGSEGLNIRDSSPGQGPEPRPWTLTLAPVCQPASRNAHAHVPGLSLGSAASVSLGNRSTADKFSASCPSWAEPRLFRSLSGPLQPPGPTALTPRQFGGEGAVEGEGGGWHQAGRSGKGLCCPHRQFWSTLPQAFPPPYAFPGPRPSAWHVLPQPHLSGPLHPKLMGRKALPALSSASTASMAPWGGLLRAAPRTPFSISWARPPVRAPETQPTPVRPNPKRNVPTRFKGGVSFAFIRGSLGF